MDNKKMEGIAAITEIRDQMLNWSLVLEAVHIPHRVLETESGWAIIVPTPLEIHAKGEIEAFEEENANWPPISDNVELKVREGQFPTLFIFCALAAFHAITGPWSEHSEWFTVGTISLERITNNSEWWRIITALTLHADPVHLMGNAVIGGMVVHFLCRTLGSGWAWFLLMFAGTFGNALNIMLRNNEHLSVGFSTAVFGAVGILCGLQASRAFNLKGLLLPLGAGAGLLALLGTSGERTDLGAHLWGLLCGIVIGSIVGFNPLRLLWKKDYPALFFSIIFLAILLCWRLAFTVNPDFQF